MTLLNGHELAKGSRRRLTRRRWARLSAFALGLALCTGMIVALAIEALNKINALNTANSDNVQWTLSQSEVEFLTFYNAVVVAHTSADHDLADLRKWFDIFYSRMDTIQTSGLYAELTHLPDLAGPFARVAGFLDATIPLMDGSDEGLRTALPLLTRHAMEIRNDVRLISLEGIRTFARQSDIQRESVSDTMSRIAALTGGLVIALLVLVFFLTRLYRISQAQATENQLTRDRLEAMLKTSLDAVLVVDKSGKFIEFNGAAEDIFGYSKAEAIGQEMTTLIFPEHLIAAHNAGMSHYLATGKERVIGKGRIQLEARRKSGEVFPVELSIARTNSPDGEIFVSFLRDISERVAADAKLLKALVDAQAGERAKAHFLAVMSHEMRTPLNGLLGSLDLLHRTKLSAKQGEYISIMQASGRMLLHHVNDVLDIAKLEAGKTSAEKTAFDLENLIREVMDGQRPLAQASGTTLMFDPGASEIGTVWGDAQGLRQVMLNLIGNAIKFTRNGAVTVGIEELESQGPRKLVEITVVDTGLGISESDLERVFDDFVTLDSSYERGAEGTGLGLGIARRVVRAMGGEIGAESEPGEGSLFWVRVPLSVPDGPSITSPTKSLPNTGSGAIAPRSVLVVEDNPINRFVVREMLEAEGHRVTEASDGDEGVRIAAMLPFDLILMDISMPRLNGIEATKQIRRGKGASAQSTIIALTAHALPVDIAQFEAAGMNGTLTKPLDSTALRAAMQDTDFRQAGGAAPLETARTSNSDPLINGETLDQLRIGLGAEKTTTLIARFLIEGDTAITGISALVLQGDHMAATAAVHALAGSAATFGATRLRNLLAGMEKDAKEGRNERLADFLAQLAEVWTGTRDAFQNSASSGVILT